MPCSVGLRPLDFQYERGDTARTIDESSADPGCDEIDEREEPRRRRSKIGRRLSVLPALPTIVRYVNLPNKDENEILYLESTLSPTLGTVPDDFPRPCRGARGCHVDRRYERKIFEPLRIPGL